VPPPEVVKLVVVGDNGVGKTCLLATHARGRFPAGKVPHVHETYTGKVRGDNVEYTVWDSPEDLRKVAAASVFLVCFSVVSRASYENVGKKWVAEIRRCAQNPLILLVGTQGDRRGSAADAASVEDERRADAQRPVTVEEGMDLARKVGAFDYIECSARNCQRVQDIFNRAVGVAIEELPIRWPRLAVRAQAVVFSSSSIPFDELEWLDELTRFGDVSFYALAENPHLGYALYTNAKAAAAAVEGLHEAEYPPETDNYIRFELYDTEKLVRAQVAVAKGGDESWPVRLRP
jgi:Ras family protein A